MTTQGLADATWVAGLLALCGAGLGGAAISEDATDSFLKAFEAAAGPRGALRAVPASLQAESLTGALDLAATLALGAPVYAQGLLSTSARLLLRRAERLDATCACHMAHALDRKSLLLLAVLDGNDPDAELNPRLQERLPFRIAGKAEAHWTPADLRKASQLLDAGTCGPSLVQDLCEAARAIGISSPRAVLQSVAAARAIAALQGLTAVDQQSAALAARLVLAHRAQHMPADEQQPEAEEAPPPPSNEAEPQQNATPQDAANAEVILEAVKAALPPQVLQALAGGLGKRGAGRNAKAAAPPKAAGQRGRRIGNRRSSSLAGQRLDVLATLRNAAPWQPLRRKFAFAGAAGSSRMVVTRDDFRVARIKQRNEATAIFAVDASGSTAFQRLAEAKGAVEAILAECYVRRDRVALVVFRSKKAEVLLPPTRSLERARRALAGLPGGGGTPLASGLDEACALAVQVRRAGGNPIIIVLTDGRGNVTREGEGNKAKALEQSHAAARLLAAQGFDAMLIDVSPEPQKPARALAEAMHATYLPMPRAGAMEIARPVSLAMRAASA